MGFGWGREGGDGVVDLFGGGGGGVRNGRWALVDGFGGSGFRVGFGGSG